MMKKKPTKS